VVQLYWTGCLPLTIHKRYPTTARHEVFGLLAIRASAGSTFLRRPGRRDSSTPTMSMPSFVRTLDQHRTTTNRTPARKSFTQPDPRSSSGYRKTPRFPVDDELMPSNDSRETIGFRMRKYKPICSFISAILIPVSFGILTIVLSLQQESIAKINRDVDLRIAVEQHQRNLELATDEQRNALLVAYIREVSDLLLANNFSLNKQILSSIVRPKTLAALRQLDAIRKGYLLRFLLESRLIYRNDIDHFLI
jgi:hypothetical protein